MNAFKRVGLATFLAYLSIGLNTAVILFAGPFVINRIGSSEYGLYKIIASFTGTLAVLDFGVGRTTTRFIARFDAENNPKKTNEVFTLSLRMICIICLLIGLSSILIKPFFINIYSKNLSLNQQSILSIMYWIAVIDIILVIIDNGITGALGGSDLYIAIHVIKIFSIFTKFVLIICLIRYVNSAVLLIMIDAICSFLRLIIGVIILVKLTDIRLIKSIESIQIIRAMFAYTGLMIMETILDAVNANADNMIIGAIDSSEKVAIYSFGLQMYSMFWQVSVAVSVVMLPVIMRLVVNGSSNTQLENAIIKAGKVQFMVLGAIDVGFILFGKDFINLWLGKEFEDVWTITIVLILSATIPAVENVTVSILRAKNTMGVRTTILFINAMINIIITYCLVYKYDYKYAAYTTAATTILFSGIIMNFYYYYYLRLNILRVLCNIISRIGISLLLAGIVFKVLIQEEANSWAKLFIKSAVFCILYFVSLFGIGISRDDKAYYLEKMKWRK